MGTSSRSSCCLLVWGRSRWGVDCCRLGPNPIWSSALTPTAFRTDCRQPWGGLNSWRATPTRWTLSWWLGTRFWKQGVPGGARPDLPRVSGLAHGWSGSRRGAGTNGEAAGKRAWPVLVVSTGHGNYQVLREAVMWVHPPRSHLYFVDIDDINIISEDLRNAIIGVFFYQMSQNCIIHGKKKTNNYILLLCTYIYIYIYVYTLQTCMAFSSIEHKSRCLEVNDDLVHTTK